MWIYGGGKYDASIPVLIMFAIRTTESAVYTICANQVLYVLHKEKFLVRVLLAVGLLNALFNVILVAAGLFTPLTAIATTFLAEVVLMGIIFWYIRVKLSIPFHFYQPPEPPLRRRLPPVHPDHPPGAEPRPRVYLDGGHFGARLRRPLLRPPAPLQGRDDVDAVR